jgi:hypothetical protein
MTNSKVVTLSLAKIQIWRMLDKEMPNLFLDCHVYTQGPASVLIVEVKSAKPFVSKIINNATPAITKLIGSFKYNIVQNEAGARISPKLAVSKLVTQYGNQGGGNISFLMNKLVRNMMLEPAIKGVQLEVKGILFGNRKSKRKISEGKQKYTGAYLREYNLNYTSQIHVPKGASGVSLKVFLKTPAKYDLKAYLDELKKVRAENE